MNGRNRRDAGIARMNNGEWAAHCWYEFRLWAMRRKGRIIRFEEFRADIEDKLPKPAHHNQWGAIARKALEAKLIAATGRWQESVRPSSHGRMVRVYRIVDRVNGM